MNIITEHHDFSSMKNDYSHRLFDYQKVNDLGEELDNCSPLKLKKKRAKSFDNLYEVKIEEVKNKDEKNRDIDAVVNKEKDLSPSLAGDDFNNNCLICCDKTADSVLMECGHGGLCFECGIVLCTNAYSHNLVVA